MIKFETSYLKYVISDDGHNIEFTDKLTGKNYIDKKENFCGKLILNNDSNERTELYPKSVTYKEPFLCVTYPNGLEAKIETAQHDNYLTFKLDSVSNEDFWSLSFTQIAVDINYTLDSSFIACCMGMTLNTRMKEYPGRNSILLGEAFTHIGIKDVKSAIIGIAEPKLLDTMKAVIDEIPDGELPKAAHSGPYAVGYKDAERAYTITGSILTVDNVDSYIEDMKKFGLSQVHLHQGGMYSQGDFTVNKSAYPNGISDFKAMIDKLHSEGIQAMLHSYTFFVAPWESESGNKYLSPIPHKDLDYCAKFTLSNDICKCADTLDVEESTDNVLNFFGYTQPASPILWIDDELVRFEKVSNGTFKLSKRGSFGTTPSEHKKGAEVKQLNSYFGYIAPKKRSELFNEIAKNNADFYNECGFDGFYLDAIDGVFVLDGNEFSWYHAVAFINEMFKYLKKAPIFNCCYGPQYPGQWYARTRMGAFDSANRGYRDFTDVHVNFNEKFAERMYLIGELGWWSLYPGFNDVLGWQNKIMYDEDIDYICSKMLATDVCQCWHDSFRSYKTVPLLESYCDKIMLYTKLKDQGYFAKAVKNEVRKPATEFDIVKNDLGEYHFRHTSTDRHRLESLDDNRNTFTSINRFGKQIPKIRIEALYTAENYDSQNADIILDINSDEPLELNKTYELNHYNTNGKRGMGIWFKGDGKGETINIRVYSPEHVARGFADHFIKVDFTGWRYFAFYEFQNGEMPHEDWKPQGLDYKVFTDVEVFYSAYTSAVNYNDLEGIDIMVNREGDYDLRMKPIVIVPSREIALNNPSVTINGQTITFKTSLKSNTFLEYSADGSCTVFDMAGHVLDNPSIEGNAPVMSEGENSVTLNAESDTDCQKRAAVTLRTAGNIL